MNIGDRIYLSHPPHRGPHGVDPNNGRRGVIVGTPPDARFVRVRLDGDHDRNIRTVSVDSVRPQDMNLEADQ